MKIEWKYRLGAIGVLFVLSHSLSANEIVARDAAVPVPEGWSPSKREDSKAVYFQRADGKAQIVIQVRYTRGGSQDLSLFLEHYRENNWPVSSVQIGDYSGYFIPFELDDGCHANWILLNGGYLLSAGYVGDCDSVDYRPVIEMIESVRPIER